MPDINPQYLTDVLLVLKNKLSESAHNHEINWYYIFTDSTLLRCYTTVTIKDILITLYKQGCISLSRFSCSPNGNVSVFIIDGITDKGIKLLSSYSINRKSDSF